MVYYDYYYVDELGISDLNDCELASLAKQVSAGGYDYYVEVGVGYLGTLFHIAQTLQRQGVTCHCIGIDCFGELPRDQHGNNTHQGDVIRLEDAQQFLFKHQINHLVTLHKGDSGPVLKRVLEEIPKARKMIFIDGNHSYEGCKADFKIVDQFVASKDRVVFHDTLRRQHPDYGRGPRGVVEDLLLDRKAYRLIRFPPADITMNDRVNTMSIFEVI